MKIGFARIDITPPEGTSMCGQLFAYRTQGVESNLYASTMYLDDGRNQVAIVSCDVLLITNEMANDTCRHAEEKTGIPGGNIILCATHTHSGPSTVNVLGASTDKRYLNYLEKGIIDSIDRARRNSVDGQLKFSQGEMEGYAFNRRFLMSDGTISTHPLKMDPHIVKVEGPDSKDLKVLCAYDASGNPMGASVNFGCHATVMERDNELISSDYPGKLTRYVAEQLGDDTVCLFLQGACGNVCQVNSLDATRKEVGVEWASKMGRDIGAKALELIRHSPTESSGPLRVITKTIEIPRRTVDPEILAWANRHKEIEAEVPTLSNYGVELYGEIKPPLVSLDEIFKSAFWSNFYASEINILYQLQKEQPVVPLTLKVLTQDNWAMIALPCELFVEWSLAIYDHSPFENTFVVELANGWSGYIPTKKAFERSGGYETKEVTSTMLIPEAGDMILQTVLEMLKEAKSK